MTKRIALFGAGRMGAIHAKTIAGHPDAVLAAIVDPIAGNAERLRAAHGAPIHDTDDVFADASIDAIVIASAAATHATLIERAAAAGKAVFCEKPIARDLATVRQAVQKLNASNVPFLLGFNRRFDPGFSGLAARLHAGEIGKAELVLLTSRDPSPPPLDYIKECGGMLRETTIHDIDVARWLTREEPSSVNCIGSALTDPAIAAAGHVDTVIVTLKMPSGVLVAINNSWRSTYGYDQRVEVHGEGGMLQLANVAPTTVVLSAGQGIVGERPLHFFLERYAQAYRREMDYFLDALTRGQALSPGARDGLRVLEIAEAAEKSLLSGQTVFLD